MRAFLRHKVAAAKKVVHQILVPVILDACLDIFEHLLESAKNVFLSVMVAQLVLQLLNLLLLVVNYFLHFGHFDLLFIVFGLKAQLVGRLDALN